MAKKTSDPKVPDDKKSFSHLFLPRNLWWNLPTWWRKTHKIGLPPGQGWFQVWFRCEGFDFEKQPHVGAKRRGGDLVKWLGWGGGWEPFFFWWTVGMCCSVFFFFRLTTSQQYIYGNVISIHHCVVVSNIFYFHPYMGKWSNLTSIFFKWVQTTN